MMSVLRSCHYFGRITLRHQLPLNIAQRTNARRNLLDPAMLRDNPRTTRRTATCHGLSVAFHERSDSLYQHDLTECQRHRQHEA